MTLLCGSRPAAEDAVQEALARAWVAGERGVHIGSVVAWVSTVAANLLRDRFRRFIRERRARARLGPLWSTPTSAISSAERRADVERALRRLPRRQREVAVLHYYLDLDLAQIAEKLQVSEGTVKGALHRARRSLAAALGELDGQEASDVANR
jgi:RNA polymerase sigma-70 factor (ECF subfamily)